MRRLRSSILPVLAVLCLAVPGFALDVGEEAPELDVTHWALGDSLNLADGKGQTVFVIQFWHTLEATAREAADSLSDFQQEQGSKGVQVVSITQQGPTTLSDFLKSRTWKQRVACDEDKNTSFAYMSGTTALPYMFVIDKEGILCWKGQDEDQMGVVVKQVLEDKFDLERARKVASLEAELKRALRESSKAKVVSAAAEALLDAQPDTYWAFRVLKRSYQEDDDQKRFKAFCKKHLDRVRDHWEFQHLMAWSLVTATDFAWRDVETAYKAANRAVELTESKNANVLDTQARVLFELGLLDRAVAAQKTAVQVQADDEDVDEEETEDFAKRLAYYEHCAAANKRVKK